MTATTQSRLLFAPVPQATLGRTLARLLASLWARPTTDALSLAELSHEQLVDIGVDPATIERPQRIIDVDGAVMRRLMSMC